MDSLLTRPHATKRFSSGRSYTKDSRTWQLQSPPFPPPPPRRLSRQLTRDRDPRRGHLLPGKGIPGLREPRGTEGPGWAACVPQGRAGEPGTEARRPPGRRAGRGRSRKAAEGPDAETARPVPQTASQELPGGAVATAGEWRQRESGDSGDTSGCLRERGEGTPGKDNEEAGGCMRGPPPVPPPRVSRRQPLARPLLTLGAPARASWRRRRCARTGPAARRRRPPALAVVAAPAAPAHARCPPTAPPPRPPRMRGCRRREAGRGGQRRAAPPPGGAR